MGSEGLPLSTPPPGGGAKGRERDKRKDVPLIYPSPTPPPGGRGKKQWSYHQ